MTLCALHEGLGDQLAAILRGTLAYWHFLFLKSMRVGRVGLEALHAEGEILASRAIKAIHLLRDGLHALIAAEP